MTSFSRERSAALVSQIGGDDPEPASAPQQVGSTTLLRPGEELELGSEAARYEIVRSLGKGGMAEVFLARRCGPSGFVREVALKCILAGMDADESARRAFLCEARLASKLRHPNIAEAYDLAQLGDRYYLVLEYVDGVTAKAVLQAARREERRLSVAFCCHVVASVAEALHHAHALTDDEGQPLAIVHRDVTASNVMISRAGAVKLLDFGIAYARLEGRERTRTGTLKGTFVYFSPEQVSDEVVDGRSDLFSLGVLLVELLTGTRVFDTGSDAGTIRKIAECSPSDVAEATRALPDELAGICAKALARRPQDRYQTGGELSRALREYLASRRETCWPSDCVEELRTLGLITIPVPDDRPDASGEVPQLPATVVAPLSTPEPPARGSSRVRWAVGAALVVAAVTGSVVAARFLPTRSRASAATTSTVVAGAPTAPEPVAAGAGAATATSAAPLAPVTASVNDPGAEPPVLLRPKKPASRPPTTTSAADRREVSASGARQRPVAEKRAAEFADRPSVATASATLARGTLIPARLVRALQASAPPGEVEALVTEEVVGDGLVLVPKGSKVACSSRPPAQGRVPLTCDAIRAGDRLLTFRGVAVGEGQHVGLRLLDEEIAAGTPFVVYVSASAAIR